VEPWSLGAVEQFRDVFRVLAIARDALPDLEVDEQPEAFPVIATGAVFVDHRLEALGSKPPARPRAIAEHEFIDHRLELFAEPAADRYRESHFAASDDFWRHEILNSLTQYRFADDAAHLQARRQR